ncbi:hypothetical protein E2562_029045 [Oryza meyeriana var. granulata]|uniref:Uncharacterized protein n=1 Tax=Oryza meyeriana var. granulata TaxID=110450 RepID=A0A6G1E5R6_9ORYZ|nr:hypothetical protein E2562_029045 [Oryza meyeriana var. granulata]
MLSCVTDPERQEEEAASRGFGGVLLRPGGSGKEQIDIGVPGERIGVWSDKFMPPATSLYQSSALREVLVACQAVHELQRRTEEDEGSRGRLLQVASVAIVGFLAVDKGTLVTSIVQRAVVVAAAVLCIAASRWVTNFIEKTFYFQDYVHADK